MKAKSTKWFEVAAKVAKMQEDGTAKAVVEQYVVDAQSFTEAEARATQYLSGYYTDFEITAEKIAKFREVWRSDIAVKNETFYKVTINFIALDEKTGKEKKTKELFLVEADSTGAAESCIHEGFNGDIQEYTVGSIVETSFVDVIEVE